MSFARASSEGDEAALRAMYAKDGPWSGATAWGSDTPACQWKGVTCTASGRVAKLNLAGFGLTVLGEELGELSELVKLSAGMNRLAALPSSLGRLKKLSDLNMIGNEISDLGSIGGCESLNSVLLTSNKLESVPDDLGELPLTKLHLDHNLLSKIPEAIGLMSGLKSLTLSSNRLGTVPPLGGLVNLTSLSLADNRLKDWPRHLPPALEVLDLSRNSITAVPRVIGLNLTELHLSYNDLGGPAEGIALQTLKILSVSFNPRLMVLPDLSRLSALEKLEVASAGLVDLPPINTEALTSLSINNNSLSGAFAACGPRIKILNANDNKFTGWAGSNTSFSPCLPSLTSVNLAGNALSSSALVDIVAGSAALEDLDASNNPLGEEFLSQPRPWPALKYLRISNTSLSISVAKLLAAVQIHIPKLLSLDISLNAGVMGGVSRQDFVDTRLGSRVFELSTFILDGTSIRSFEAKTTAYFPNLRQLSLRNLPFLSGDELPPLSWLHLERLDIRGSLVDQRLKGLHNAFVFPPAGSSIYSEGYTCPAAVLAGDISRFLVFADPPHFEWLGCQCEGGRFGEPALACLPCPRSPSSMAGSSRVTADCQSGRAVVTGGWFLFKSGVVLVVRCPSDSQGSPCRTSTLSRTVRTLAEWDRAMRGADATLCEAGYTGRLCSRCASNFFRSGRACYPCRGSRLSWLQPVLSILALSLIGIRTVSSPSATRSGLLRTLMMHAQLVALLPDMSLRLTSLSSMATRAVSTGVGGGLRLDGLECAGAGSFDGYGGPFYLACALPAVVLLGSLWIACLTRALPFRSKTGFWALVASASLFLIQSLFFGALQRLLSPLNCSDYGSSSGTRFIVSALWIECKLDRGGVYPAFFFLGALLAPTYALVNFAVIVLFTRRAGTRIGSYLRAPYSSTSWFWEAVQFFRRVSISLANTLSPFGEAWQPVAVSSILLIALTLQAHRKPFATKLDNLFETASLAVLVASYIAGIIGGAQPGAGGVIISWVVFGVNAIFLVALFLTAVSNGVHKLAKSAIKRGSSKEIQDTEVPLLSTRA